ncbi:intradiol ring-cleavage dioxygenase [Haloferax volcanii]|uniref:Dioxygenase family protein n=3 Tax=Haloferax volcanii TaxID=2246 RepID=D4GUP6_HALVD|nr:intradiol ring-cleavage dioxygenase [Haloferax volcanii]ADE02274.1 dioxygenase family protein [Haloferax volcanii DS2]ELY33692.1 putative dioxygenase [Haloferax volcanii DS2]MBS8119279.1 intradiol ring-cleavage dioxygenase [Haloferax volcanii]MBS8124292.1 intradiol ring-cleavage dioxygenase [Haloferax volcanii]MBS8128161.1 intradiol ring-cleavage dioxygenase [Haloferax volcanii]
MSTDDPDYPATGTMTDTSVTTSDGTTACVAQPELTEGPYYVDENLRRSDIRADSDTGEQEDGVRLDLGFKVFELTEDSCTPLDNAIVDVWHANASGVYSDVEMQNTVGQDFLRGIQLTDDAGAASFTTIYPGWYTGRAVHIHFKVRSSDDATEAYEFTSQLFFDDDLTDRVYTQAPYADRGDRDTLNSEDNIFQQDNAAQLVLDLTETSEGYSGTLNVALYTSGETAADDSFSAGGGGPGEPPNGSEPSSDSNPPATMNDTTTE